MDSRLSTIEPRGFELFSFPGSAKLFNFILVSIETFDFTKRSVMNDVNCFVFEVELEPTFLGIQREMNTKIHSQL